MRKTWLVVMFLLVAGLVRGGETGRVFLPDFLPANTILCLVPPDGTSVEQDYSQTIFARIANLPEMGPFLRSFEESRRRFAQDISQTAEVPPQFAYDLVNSHLGFALINIGLGRDGKPLPEFVIAIALSSTPDRDTVFAAVMALLNRPEVVRTVLESQGLDPNLPLRTLAQEETITNGPPILRIGPNIRVAALGNHVILYHGPGSEGITKLFAAYQNPAQSLSRSPSFVASYRGVEAVPGSSMYWFNLPRVISVLDAFNLSAVSRVLEAIGFGSVQSMAMATQYHQEGVRHTVFLHTPNGATSGLMSSLVPMPGDSPLGMEGYANIIPSTGNAFAALRVDLPTLLREVPYLVNSLGAITRPGGMSGLVANERVLGVPIPDILSTLGSDIVIRPHDDTQVLMFHNVDIAGFENVVARMEQNAGTRFSSLNVGGYIVRYFNRRSSLTVPLAPAFCLVPRSPGSSTGILYMASHPQAVTSLIRESTSAREPLINTPDFVKASTGIGGQYSLFYYNNSRDAYRRVYNFLLPVLSLWSSSARYPVDTGLLPTASTITPAMFGSAVGIRLQGEGMQIQAFSPIGSGAILVQLADKLVVSNPLVIAHVYSALEKYLATMPTW